MTKAVISGQAKTALLIDGGAMFSFDIDAPEILIPRREPDLHFLFGAATDLRFLENTEKEKVISELQADYEKTCSLDLALMLLDADISEAKPLIAEALEDLFSEEKITTYLESIFYAKPLPPAADTENALKACSNNFPLTYNWLSTLIDKQEDIKSVSKVWAGIAQDIFGDAEKYNSFQKVLIDEGVFRELVLNCRDPQKINTAIIELGLNKAVTSMPNYRPVLQKILASFKQPIASSKEKRVLEDEEENFAVIRQKGKQRLDRKAIKDNVQSQIESINNFLKKRDLARARNRTNELIEYQSGKGEKIHLVKSLCQLAQNAKELGFYTFQLELAEKAIELEYSDAWTQIQYGDALLRNNRLDDAITTYAVAISFAKGKDAVREVVARAGYAEVLKAQGRLDEALQIYQETMLSHPENVVVRNGYAEVLKAQGRLDEALQIYQETMLSHPENVVVRTGYAEVLKAQGKLDEALQIYQETMLSHPENVVVRTGYAEVLKAQGKLDEALQIYQETMLSHPENVVVRTGYAEVLKAQGKLDEALQIYRETILSHPGDVVVRNGCAEVLKAQGKLDEALQIYRETMLSHPQDVVVRTGLCGILFMLKKFDEALEKLPNDNLVTHSDWIGYHIRGMIELGRGNLTEAARIFERGEQEDPIPASREYFRSTLAIVKLRQGNFEKASDLLDKVITPVLQPAVSILRAHTYGELEMYSQAELAFHNYEKLAAQQSLIAGYQKETMFEAAAEIKSRYVTSKVRTKPDSWLFDKEEAMLLALAP